VEGKGETGDQRFEGGYRAEEIGDGGSGSSGKSEKVVGGPGRGDGKPVASPEAVRRGRVESLADG